MVKRLIGKAKEDLIALPQPLLVKTVTVVQANELVESTGNASKLGYSCNASVYFTYLQSDEEEGTHEGVLNRFMACLHSAYTAIHQR